MVSLLVQQRGIILVLLILMTPAFMLVGIETIHAQDDVDPSFFSTDPLWLEDSPVDPNCIVDIRGDSPTMYPGNFTSLLAVVRGGVMEKMI